MNSSTALNRETVESILSQLSEDASRTIDSIRGIESEVCAGYEKKLKVIFEGNEFSLAAENEERIYGIRVIDGGRPGFVSTNQPSTLSQTALDARSMARLAPASEFQCLPRGAAAQPVLAVDEDLALAGPKDAIRLLSHFTASVQKDPRVSIDRAEVSFATRIITVRNSHGLSSAYAVTSCDYYVMGMARQGDEVTSFDYDGSVLMRRKGLEEQMTATAEEFRNSVIGSLGPRPGKSYRGAVLLHPRAVSDLFGGLVSFNCNARMHQDESSPWRGRMNDRVASEYLRVTETPLDRQRAEGYAPFDREGVPCSEHALIDAGRLNFIAHSAFTARRGGVSVTGNATGSPRAVPGIGFSNLEFSIPGHPESVTEEELFRKLPSGLLIVRFSGNDDPVSGEFSGVAKNSSWLEHGTLRPVSEVMVSGNAFELLRNTLAGTTRVFPVFGGSHAPYLLVEGVSVTAGYE